LEVDTVGELKRNKLYEAGKVPAVGCRLPGAEFVSRAVIAKYADAVLACLDRAWVGVVDRSGNLFEPPRLKAYAGKTDSDCGPNDDVAAFYCPEDLTIYFDWTYYLDEEVGDQLPAEIELLFMVSHEYGHHLQQMVGLDGLYELRQQETEGAVQLQETRRMELQASCFAAAFLGANRRPLGLAGERLEVFDLLRSEGDDPEEPDERDHGSGASNEAWTSAAFNSRSPSSCNTWAAPTARVS
jgi:predicted metalloprotease